MKLKLEKRYIQMGITIFLTAMAIFAVYYLVTQHVAISENIKTLNKILSPITYGLILAYLVTPVLNFVERKWVLPVFDKNKWYMDREDSERKSIIRKASLAITLIIIFVMLYLFFKAVIPEVYKSVSTIISQYSVYTTNLVDYVNKLMEENPDLAKYLSTFVVNASEETDNYLNDVVLPAVQSLLLPNISDWLKNFTTSVMNIFKAFWNIIIGIIISIYVLSGKERVVRNGVKLLYSVFDVKFTNRFVDSIRFVHHTFIGFFAGKIADSLIIGVICYICLLIMKMPYAALISLLIGVTNIIPFVGPFIGAVPSVILVLMIDPKQALILGIFIVILQQVDGNIIGPKILSGSTGVNAFWILFSITLFGGLWGIVGMIVGVPITAVVISGIKRISNKRLENKNLPTNSELYEELGHIEEDGTFVKYVYVKPPKKEPDAGTKKLISLLKKAGIGIKNFGIFLWTSIKMLFEKVVALIKNNFGKSKNKPKNKKVNKTKK